MLITLAVSTSSPQDTAAVDPQANSNARSLILANAEHAQLAPRDSGQHYEIARFIVETLGLPTIRETVIRYPCYIHM